MTRNIAAATAALLVLTGIYLTTAVDGAPADAKSGKVLRHVVLFKFKDGTSPGQVQEVVDAFRSLKDKVEGIVDFEFGTDVSTENKAQGFTHCFFVTFRDEKGRDAYLPHPAHKAFGALVGPRLDKVLVVDYWTEH